MSDMLHKRRSFWIMLATQFAMYLFTTLFFIIAAVWAIPESDARIYGYGFRFSWFYEVTIAIMFPVVRYWYLFVPLSFLGFVINVAVLYGLGCLPDKVRWFSLAWFVFGLVMMVLFIIYIVWVLAYPQWFLSTPY